MDIRNIDTPFLIQELRKRIGPEEYINYHTELEMLATDIEVEGKDAYYAKESSND